MTARAILRYTGVELRPGDATASTIMLVGVVMSAVHRAFFTPDALARLIPSITRHDGVSVMFLVTPVLFGIVPALAARALQHASLRDLGVTTGDWRFGATSVALLLPVISVALLWPGAHDPAMRAAFPLDPAATATWRTLAIHECLRIAFFYAMWEFFFRGFMLFGLRKSIGDWPAICVQVIPSCLWHVGMPTPELLSSIAGGVLFGLLALRTRSILWPMVLHTGIGVVTDIFIVLT